MLVGQHNRPPGQAPRWPFTLDWDSNQSRGIVLAAPFLQGPSAVELVKGRVFSWSGTEPSSTIPTCPQGRPIGALSIDGNNSGYISTSDDYGLAGVNTLTVEWWMSEDDTYSAADGTKFIVSNRKIDNTGWSASRKDATTGPPGGATRPNFTIQSVADYYPSTYDIPARTWCHVCITLNGTALAMYVNGVSVHTATTGAMTNGDAMLLLGQGPSGFAPWINNVHSIIVRNVPLTAAEVSARANPSTTFGVYHELGRRTWFLPGAAAAGFLGAWASQRSRIIGAGLH